MSKSNPKSSGLVESWRDHLNERVSNALTHLKMTMHHFDVSPLPWNGARRLGRWLLLYAYDDIAADDVVPIIIQEIGQ